MGLVSSAIPAEAQRAVPKSANTMLPDYKVDYRREETIKHLAAACLAAGGIVPGNNFDITKFVETSLTDYCKRKGKGELRVLPFDRVHKYDEVANVTFSPHVVLHIDKAIWADAKAGGERSRLIVAHEIGHIVLHDHTAKAFSDDPSLRIKFAEREYSAEWQADTFAEYFLVPDEAVRRFPDESLLGAICNVSLSLARKRLVSYFGSRGLLVDAPCDGCGNFALFREGSDVRCFVCPAKKAFHPQDHADPTNAK
jgi:IrrE N-terminal-like domain